MSDQTRVLLWAIPRTCSTILLKSMSSIPDSQMIIALFTTAYFFGPNKVKHQVSPEPTYEGIELDKNGLLNGPGSGFKSSICTFDWVKQQLEADYQGKKVIISKEMAPWINKRYDLIPKGYRHIFLIRNPYKVFPSWKKMEAELSEPNSSKLSPEDPVIDQSPKGASHPEGPFKDMTDLWLHIKDNNLDADPIIIDSDDLLNNPKEILSAVCSRVGIPYSDALLSWEAGSKITDQWIVSSPVKHMFEHRELFQNFKTSTNFLKPVSGNKIPDLATFSPDVQCCIESSMPYYLKLYEQRLKC